MSRYERNKYSYSYDEDVIDIVNDDTIMDIINYKERCASLRVEVYQSLQYDKYNVKLHQSYLFEAERILYDVKEIFYTKYKSREIIERFEIKDYIKLLNRIIEDEKAHLRGLGWNIP